MRWTLLLAAVLAVSSCGSDGSPPSPPSAANCTAFLQWVPPIERMDGTPLTIAELDKFTIFVSESPDPRDMLITLVVEVTDANMISWEVVALSAEQHFFWVTVTDTEGRESGPSNVEDKDCSP